MKKIIKAIAIMSMILFYSMNIKAQITLEHAYYYFHKQFYITDIGNNDYKYVMLDSTGFSLFNLDHSLFINVVTPYPIFQQLGYQVAYITKSLFDCDSTNIEYVLATPNGSANFYIYRTDGTILFERDSVAGPYGFGYQLGSTLNEPITNTPEGAKLLLFTHNNAGVADSMLVYSLCGVLPLGNKIAPDENYVQIYPNPTNGIINFNIKLPNNFEQFKLTIYNTSFQIVDQTIVKEQFSFDASKWSLSSGTYFFDLQTPNKLYQTGKFILTK